MKKLAQIDLAPEGGFKGFGTLGLEETDAGQAPSIFASFISSAIGIISVIAIIWFVFQFITGAVAIISSGGDKNSLEVAKKKMSTGVIGLVVTILAIFVIRFVGSIIGIPNILNFVELFTAIQIQ